MKKIWVLYLVLTALCLQGLMIMDAYAFPDIPWGLMCRKDCDEEQSRCHDRADRFKRRCERYMEEAQCYEHYQFKIRICNREFGRCMSVCGNG